MILSKSNHRRNTIISFILIAASLASGQWRPDPEGYVDFTSSHLPVILIDTNGKRIVDSPRIVADMKVIDNKDGHNSLTDSTYTYNGKIAIELRGSSSSSYPKKQYRLETQDEAGENLNVPLLGLPVENDWILYGPYDDESLIRNALAYKWSNDIGRYAPRTKFCEVILNNDYRGLYLLVEKIKRDNDRVDIARLDADDVAGDSLTGGYIIKIDKSAGENNDGWSSARGVRYQYDYPKPRDIQSEQKNYIKRWMNNFETAMIADWNIDDSFLDLLDLDSFVDHFLLNELCKNVDAYRISAFMYKDRDDNNGKLFMGPIWDFNLSMAKAWYDDDLGLFEGWQVDYRQHRPSDGSQPPFWWEKLAHHTIFQKEAQARWESLRQATFHQDSLFADINLFVSMVGDAKDRNFEKWPGVLEDNESYESKISELKEWLTKRLAWIDSNIKNLVSGVHEGTNPVPNLALAQNFPNPFNPETAISFSITKSEYVDLSVHNTMGQKLVTLMSKKLPAGTHQIAWDASELPSGMYFYFLRIGEKVLTGKMMLVR